MDFQLEDVYKHNSVAEEYFYGKADRVVAGWLFDRHERDSNVITPLLVRQCSVVFGAMAGCSFTPYMLNILGRTEAARYDKLLQLCETRVFLAKRKFKIISTLLDPFEIGFDNVYGFADNLTVQDVFGNVLVEAEEPRVLGSLVRILYFRNSRDVYYRSIDRDARRRRRVSRLSDLYRFLPFS